MFDRLAIYWQRHIDIYAEQNSEFNNLNCSNIIAQFFEPVTRLYRRSYNRLETDRFIVHLKVGESLFIFGRIVPVIFIVSGNVISEQFRVLSIFVRPHSYRYHKKTEGHYQHYHHHCSPLHHAGDAKRVSPICDDSVRQAKWRKHKYDEQRECSYWLYSFLTQKINNRWHWNQLDAARKI